ncbi:Aldose 1-epimerase [Maribacter sedimenticola]|uniref:Aldose 1-epimerase n=1 Tax=Maribacter sedimenticola TaxID=228956 RepID=A0ABY1SE01_9FLAO|nr:MULTISPECIES: aldose epimerase [Maribacter]TVZ16905.1 aldose 1-epimerase [Maribacter sp. MAR_2009_72]SNR30015.1 Aldose 1-epimerase [Maribacter sedimenticola]
MSNKITLKSAGQSVRIEEGELVGFQVSGHEFMHQKGNPGWRNVDTEMFPIIGPTAEADFRVHTPKSTAVQDQHGLLREMTYTLLEHNITQAVYHKTYRANTQVVNSKYPKKSTEEILSWPYDFEFKKSFELTENGLEIVFTISGEEGMPFMLGYHPAFMLHTQTALITTENNEYSIEEVLQVGSRALHVPNVNSITLHDDRSLQVLTEGFSHFMLWTEVPNMVCIEPITFYPYAVAQQNLDEGFMVLNQDMAQFKVLLKPL